MIFGPIQTRRMAEIMEEVLLIGSFDAGKMEFKPAARSLKTLCFDSFIFKQKQTRSVCLRAPHGRAREDLKRNWRSAHLAVFREVQESGVAGVQEEKTCWYRRTMNAWAESTVKA